MQQNGTLIEMVIKMTQKGKERRERERERERGGKNKEQQAGASDVRILAAKFLMIMFQIAIVAANSLLV